MSDPAVIEQTIKMGQALAAGATKAFVMLWSYLRLIAPRLGLGLLLVLFLMQLREVDLPAGAALFLVAAWMGWRGSIGAVVGILLYYLTLILAKELVGDLGELYVNEWEARHLYWLAAKVLVVVLVVLEALALIRLSKGFGSVLVGLAVFTILFAFPGYQVRTELKRRHTFTNAELASVKGLIESQQERKFMPIAGAGPKDTIEVLRSKVYTNKYGVAKLEHAIRVDQQVYVAELLIPYDRIALPAPVPYFNGGDQISITYLAPDSILVTRPQENGNSSPRLALSEDLIRTQRNAGIAELEEYYATRADSLNQKVSMRDVLVQGGYCLEHCFLRVLDVETQMATDLYFPATRIPGGDIDLFVDQVMKEGQPWRLTSRWTVLRSKNEEGFDEWTEREEVLTLKRADTPKPEPVKPPSSKREILKATSKPVIIKGRVIEDVVSAEYPGGQGALNKFISSQMQYPSAARDAGVSGVVVIKITVLADGRVTDRAVKRSKDPALDKEALRIVGLMPNWSPAISEGRAVTSSQDVIIRFTIR